MKIIHVEDYFDPEAGYQINELLKIKEKAEIWLLCSKDMKPFHKQYSKEIENKDRNFEEKYGVKIKRLDTLFKIGSRIFYKNLKKEILKLNPDILFLHGIGDFKDLLFLFKKYPFLTFRDCHMSWIASRNKYAKLYYKFYSKTFAKIINNKDFYICIYALGIEEKEYLQVLGIKEEKIKMLPHGYNKNIYFYDKNIREKFRKKLKIKNEILISYVGKFDNFKQPHLILKIIKQLGEEYILTNKLKFLFLGPKNIDYIKNTFEPLYEDLALKIQKQIIIMPGRKAEELNEVYNGSDICLWPQETTLSSIHAQVTKTLCIMENHSSNRERVIDNSNLYSIGNLDEAEKILKNIIKNEKYLKKKNEFYIENLEKREYHYQVKNLYQEWEIMCK